MPDSQYLSIEASVPDIIYKAITEGMTFVSVVRLGPYFSPVGIVGEESIRLGRFVINLRQTKAVSPRKCLPINAGTADDKYFFVGLTTP